MRGLLTLIAIVAIGCGGATPAATTFTPIHQACDDAFAAAAAVDPMNDTITDLDPALRACESVAEWAAAAGLNPGAIEEGVDPVVFLHNRCQSANVAALPLCQEATR